MKRLSGMALGMMSLPAFSSPVLGEEASSISMQYYRPGGDYFVGDCMPFYHDGLFHLYYLRDENHHQGLNGLGGHQWAHVSSRDLIHWEQHPLAIGLSDDWEASICTGSVFYHDGIFHGYYATRKKDWSEHLSVAVSQDAIHFTKTEPRIFASPEGPYRPGPYRDPFVFQDEQTGLFHLIATAELKDPEFPGHGGCLAHLTSKDLTTWTTEAPFYVPGYHGQPECSELFYWNKWYYLIFSIDGIARYRMAHHWNGPWITPAVDTLDSPMARVMKTAAFGDRRIGVAFLPTLENDKDDGNWQYAGVTLFREIRQDFRGYLWTSFVPEMIPATGAPLSLKPLAIPEGVSYTDNRIETARAQGWKALFLEDLPKNIRITCEIRASGAGEFGIGFRSSGKGKEGYEMCCSPARQKIEVRPCSMNDADENGKRSIYDINGLHEMFHVDILLKEDLVDISVSTGREWRCLINRFAECHGTGVYLFVRNAQALFENVTICPILPNSSPS